MSLYLQLEIYSITIPLLLSFDKKLRFYKMWKSVFLSIFISGVFFIIPDIIFTKLGIWGFNPRYHSGIILSGLPLEEWLFFILIPYSSLFIHYVFVLYSNNYLLSNNTVRIISGLVISILLLVIVFNFDKTYTSVYSVLLILLLLAALFSKMKILNNFFLSFPIILVPFFIVNAILTGTFIEGEVVWYNNSEILGIRLLTVPVEDVGYAFCLIILNLILNERFRILFGKGAPKARYEL
jgi:lycopene cyclase domain-containing protein